MSGAHAWIKEIIEKHQPPIHGFHQLRTRKTGHCRFIKPWKTAGSSLAFPFSLDSTINTP